jgi:hypothetical protein
MLTRSNIRAIGAAPRYGSSAAPEMLHDKTLNGRPASFEVFNTSDRHSAIDAAPPVGRPTVPSLKTFYRLPYAEAMDLAESVVAQSIAAGSGTGERTASRQGKVYDTLFERAKWRREEVRISHPGAPRAANDNCKKENAA